MTFERNLLTLREKKRLTQEALAQKIGASKQMVSNWEKGKNRPSQKYIDKLVTVFDIKAVDLYRESEENLTSVPKAEEEAVGYSKDDHYKKMAELYEAIRQRDEAKISELEARLAACTEALKKQGLEQEK